jgi:ABC-2 type transport system permease protein
MPGWLQAFAKVNPVTYATDAARQLMLTPQGVVQWGNVANDFLFLGAFATVFAAIGIVLSWRYLSK